MASKEYLEKLKDPRWQKKRLEIFKRDNFTCRECGSTEKTLHAHHLYYIAGHEPWYYSTEAFHTLCADCHELTHDDKKYAIEDVIKALARRGQNHKLLGDLAFALDSTGWNAYCPIENKEFNSLSKAILLILQLQEEGESIQNITAILGHRYLAIKLNE